MDVARGDSLHYEGSRKAEISSVKKKQHFSSSWKVEDGGCGDVEQHEFKLK